MAPKDRYRKHLPNQTPLKQWSYFLDAFEKCQNVVVVAGAGILTAAESELYRLTRFQLD
jgi:hypothetical protein